MNTDKVRDALIEARDTFLRYAELHRAKGTHDGDIKALDNANMAWKMENALAADPQSWEAAWEKVFTPEAMAALATRFEAPAIFAPSPYPQGPMAVHFDTTMPPAPQPEPRKIYVRPGEYAALAERLRAEGDSANDLRVFVAGTPPPPPPPQPWTGCGECDVSFQCHDGERRCIRLPLSKPDKLPDAIGFLFVNGHRGKSVMPLDIALWDSLSHGTKMYTEDQMHAILAATKE